MNIVKIKNDSGSIVIWAGKEFAIDEEYVIPTDGNRVKWQNNSTLLIAIAASDALIGDGTSYLSDVNESLEWLKGNVVIPADTDGVPLSRTKITQSGWHFQAHTFEFCTATLSSTHSKDIDDSDLGFLSIKYYDASDVELVAGTQAELDSDCVKTVVDWEADFNYEIIGGTLYQSTMPTTDVRLWIQAVPDLTHAQGGSIPFVEGGLNLKHMGTGSVMDLDGKTPKLMSYNATYHTNKFRFVIRHNTGINHELMVVFKIFEE